MFASRIHAIKESGQVTPITSRQGPARRPHARTKSHNGASTPATMIPTPAPAPIRPGTPVPSAVPVRSGTPVASVVPVCWIVRSRSGVVRSAVVAWAPEVVKGKWERQRDSETHSISACWLLGAQGESRNNEKREKYLFHGSLQVVSLVCQRAEEKQSIQLKRLPRVIVPLGSQNALGRDLKNFLLTDGGMPSIPQAFPQVLPVSYLFT